MPLRHRRPAPLRRVKRSGILAGAGAAVVALLLTGCNETFTATKGVTKQAHDEFSLWFWMMVAGIAVAVFVWGLIFWAIIAYRRKGDEIPKQVQEHIPLEITYTVIPLLMVLAIFAATFVVENKVDDVLTPPQVIVNVTAYQWGWIFQYSKPGLTGANCVKTPQDCVTVQTAPNAAPSALAQPYTSPIYPQLVLPEGEVTRFFLRSNDVIHGFFVHAFNFSRYAQPGVVNSFEATPTEDGVFYAQCTQYCGLYHSEMLFSVKILPPAQFTAWFSQQEKNLPKLPAPPNVEGST